ncbi:MAG: HEAT repeat domain-containing protein [Acidobacteriota bacterium]|nr:HEAT repeat domain-containing protein [Acidobacteriota bacterium]
MASSADKDLRQVVAAELLAAMSGREAEEMAGHSTENVNSAVSSQKSVRDPKEAKKATHEDPQQISSSAAEPSAPAVIQATSSEEETARQETERARQLFLEHGYFDEAVQDLRAAKSSAERAAAARALGLVGSGRGTPHLIAAMFDEDPEVRSAAEEALAQIGDPTASSDPASAPLINEQEIEQLKAADALQSAQASTVEEVASTNSKVQDLAAQVDQRSGPDTQVERFGRGSRATGKSRKTRSASKTPEVVSAKSPVEEVQGTGTQLIQQGVVDDSLAASEENQLLQEERAVRDTVQQLESQLIESAETRKKLENETRSRTEQEAKLRAGAVTRRREEEELRNRDDEEAERLRSQLRAEAVARRREEEELRQRADEESERLRSQENEALAAEQGARLTTETEAHRLAEQESRMRIEAVELRLAAEELARQRTALERARREAAEAAQLAEAKRTREEAEARHNSELERLRSEEEALRTSVEEVALRRSQVDAGRQEASTEIELLREEQAQLAAAEAARRAEAERLRRDAEDKNRAEQEQLLLDMEGSRHVAEEVSRRRSEVAVAREKADEDAQQLLAAQERMRAAAEVRAQAEEERLQVEAEINQRVETEQRLLAEARRHAQEEQERLDEETRRRKEEEQRRLAELEVARTKAEIESKQRVEKEHQILSQIDSLRIADAETRKRIEEAEVRRRAAEEAYRLVAEKVQRVEAEAHVRAKEEEQILAKLEAERRTVAVEAQARAAQEKRIKEEIELFRRLEEEERPRIEVATLQRAEAEARLQQQKDRLKVEEEARLRAEDQLNLIGQYRNTATAQPAHDPEWREGGMAKAATASLVSTDELVTTLPQRVDAGVPEQATISVDNEAISSVPPTVSVYLNSVDPYKRAAAVAELARSHSKDAFSLIANCFDDHSPQVRNAAARALRKLEPTRSVDLFNRALEGGSAERRRNIGRAIAASGVAAEAIDNLVSESREDTYNALSILFVMAKTGEVQPLVKAIEEHHNDEISKAIIKLLTLSGQSELADAALKRRVNGRQANA